jgi:hypothetical protein
MSKKEVLIILKHVLLVVRFLCEEAKDEQTGNTESSF